MPHSIDFLVGSRVREQLTTLVAGPVLAAMAAILFGCGIYMVLAAAIDRKDAQLPPRQDALLPSRESRLPREWGWRGGRKWRNGE